MILAFDTETTGLDPWHGCRPYIVSMIDDSGKDNSLQLWRWRVDPFSREVDSPNSERLEILDRLDEADIIVGHNVRFDLRMLEMSGISLPSNIWEKTHDTILMSHCLASAGPHGLKELGLKHLDILDDDEEALRQACIVARRYGKKLGWRVADAADPHWPGVKSARPGMEWWKSDMWMPQELIYREDELKDEYELFNDWWDICEVYARRDVERTIGLYFYFMELLSREGLEAQYEVRRQNLRATYDMESVGMTFRRFLSGPVREKHRGLAAKHEKECFIAVKHQIDNLASPKQLQSAMYQILGMPVINRTEKSCQPSTDKDTIAELRKDHIRPTSRAAWFLKNLIGYRKRDHATGTIESWEASCLPYDDPKQHRFMKLHPNHNQTGTATTRRSLSDPNGQNIAKGEGLPKEEKFNLRDLFGPRLGRVWFTHDYSNIELRIFAHLSGEQEWLRAFEEGESVHLIVAKELYPDIFDEHFKTKYPHLYQWVKNGNFSLTYGAGQKTADDTYHVLGAYRKIRRRFKQVDRFMDICIREAKDHGFVTTMGGYRLDVPLDRVFTTAVDYKVQGSAGYAMNLAENRCNEYIRTLPDHHTIMTIHDELLHEAPETYDPAFPYEIKRLMELSGDDLGLVLPVEMGRIRISWDQEEDVPELLSA